MADNDRVCAKDFIRSLSREPEWSLSHPNGRLFTVRRLDDGQLFLTEAVPTGTLFSVSDELQGIVYHKDPVLAGLLEAVSPNNLLPAVLEAGIDPESMCATENMWGPCSLYYESLEACAKAVNEAIRADTWYTGEDEAKERDPEFQAALRRAEEQGRAAWHEHERQMQQQALQEKGIFKGCRSMLGPLSDLAKQQILSYLNRPTEEQWEAIYPLIITGGINGSLWSAWAAVDPCAPRSKAIDGEWEKIPDPDMLRKAIRHAVRQHQRHMDESGLSI